MKLKLSRKRLLRLTIFLVSIVIVYLVMPRETGPKYEYSVGRLWNYDPLVTSIDVPVFNDEARQKAIKDSLVSNFKPIYYRNETTAQKVITEYRDELNTRATNLTASERNRLLNAIRDIYDVGIYDSRGGAAPKAIRIHVAKDSVSEPYPVASFHSFASAHNKLRDVFKTDTAIRSVISHVIPNILPNIVYDSVQNQSELDVYEKYATAAAEVVHAGSKIVDRGDLITAHTYNVIRAYEAEMALQSERDTSGRFISGLGTLAVIAILISILFGYLALLRHDYYNKLRVILLMMVFVVVFVILSVVLSKAFELGLYLVPFAMVPIVLLVFLDSRTAFFTYIITILLCASVNHLMWDFIVLQFAAGFVGLISIRQLSKRSQLIRAGAMVFLTYSFTYTAFELMQTGSFHNIDTSMFGVFAINCILLSLAYIVIFLVEKAFGFISRVTLVELSDINHPLLRELSEECPGTFQHSMAVSNLAASAASRLGANVQLVRAGALYHDIGKISNPAFFTENQHGINPHDALSPIQSAKIVIGHVTDGVRRADKAKLPSQLRDFILQHHGTGKARYFYTTYCNQHPDEVVDPTPFTYPGPNPQTLEASILMMADAVEAASRSLTDHSPEAIDALVNKIIDSQVREGLHNDSPISFRDITAIKRSFASTLRTMYHSRISYPEAIKPEGEKKPSESDINGSATL
ncbi:MAG: HDIG domain-containing protein [Bacteroides sp.]|nr:HDIG domain-containing protein [Bacteroides sp.]MCM1413582.1 HDIG domain-containing protein [Bacteroides sp.]MCM1471201.1 HDIG domain-containing protein [Bacteroides sp.]